jgi:hypothetical protein
MSEIDHIRKQLDEIEHKYNKVLEELQQIADAKGDMASADPDYIQKYDDASALNARFEALQSQLAELEAAAPPAPAAPVAPEGPEVPADNLSPDVAGAIDAIDAIDAAAPADSTAPAQAPAPEVKVPEPLPVPGGAEAAPSDAATAPDASAAEPVAVAPPASKYVTVERTRVEVEKIQEQSWNFIGIASNVSPAVQELANKGGYITENVLEKKFGKLTLLCPFEVDFPIGGLVSGNARRSGAGAGLIYYPQAVPSPQASSTLGQLLQQFLASGAPRGHVVAFLKVNKVEGGDDKASVIVGGLTDQDGRILQGLKRLGNVFSDNGMFFKGNLLDDVKSIATKVGLKLITLVITSNIIQDQAKLQSLVESF